ncbi:hypothetical protein [Actinacidiphila glaucinigra]|uniref:hypothetical protein n=1 Tax=Actinacidiphila glaucinigra TaxID=235986 RepID=UPI0035E0A0FC
MGSQSPRAMRAARIPASWGYRAVGVDLVVRSSVEPVPADITRHIVDERARSELRGKLATLLTDGK